MPGFASHHFFGLNAYKCISGSLLGNIIKKYHHAYSLGEQGPDLFFYFLLTSTKLCPNIADKMHKEHINFFFEKLMDNCCEYFHGKDFNIACAYTLGYLGHYILDTNMHPYIYSRIGTGSDYRTLGIHFGLESDIDRIILWKNKKLRPAEFLHNRAVRLSDRERKVVATLLRLTIKDVYNIKLSESFVHLVIKCFDFESGFLADPTLSKHRFINFFEKKLFGYPVISPLLMNDITHMEDPCNTEHRRWCNPYNTSICSNESVFNIMNRCLPCYVTIMKQMYKTLLVNKFTGRADKSKVLKMIGNKSFNTGLEC